MGDVAGFGFRQCFFGCGVVAVEPVIRVQFRV